MISDVTDGATFISVLLRSIVIAGRRAASLQVFAIPRL
jgi:hypothetical protein